MLNKAELNIVKLSVENPDKYYYIIYNYESHAYMQFRDIAQILHEDPNRTIVSSIKRIKHIAGGFIQLFTIDSRHGVDRLFGIIVHDFHIDDSYDNYYVRALLNARKR